VFRTAITQASKTESVSHHLGEQQFVSPAQLVFQEGTQMRLSRKQSFSGELTEGTRIFRQTFAY